MTPLTREGIAARLAQDISDGWHVNLGIGMPEQVANYLPEGRDILLHSENGILGMGPTPPEGQEDETLVNAGKKPITMLPGASIFDHALSFGLVRGGHLQLCVLGAYQVAENGDIANWSREDNDPIASVGGAMDLAVGAQRIWVTMQHNDKSGAPRILEHCTYPLTGVGCVKRIYTDLAVIDVTPEGFLVTEIIDGMTPKELQDRSGARLRFADGVGKLLDQTRAA
ncbi:3-oxoacid CoA-transferase subunit B [Pseudooceanicola sp. 216_PA32_1]|uniref:3-oxoacid CoA-transferase subunit B n=1 Tax=Pseudooceanicola pacificus TaxID=2676438 RepID=A0A844WD11_9RHOB|nr:3-oxoacid CoA-transferase subunit B [Pseudooceanicola pacificus]MWB78988.1 3-oxoacid CoA-transferase subunit B [Pseudooceanicola pacificus]